MTRFTMEISDQATSDLWEIARAERRRSRDQATILLEQAISKSVHALRLRVARGNHDALRTQAHADGLLTEPDR